MVPSSFYCFVIQFSVIVAADGSCILGQEMGADVPKTAAISFLSDRQRSFKHILLVWRISVHALL
jgi:hypothetical protein